MKGCRGLFVFLGQLHTEVQLTVVAIIDPRDRLVRQLGISSYRSVFRLRGKLRRTGNFFTFGHDSLRWIHGR